MERYPDSTRRFGIVKGLLNIPYTGFTTFQHFRGEPLFTDYLDGWKKEYYPLHPDAHAEGNGTGYHPDSNIAYYRFIWKDIEPNKGEYDFSIVDKLIEGAKAHGQTLMLRLMPHTTRPDQDIPDWLKAEIPHPERPPEERVKDSPTDRKFFEYFAAAVREFGRRYDGDPNIMLVDISLCGSWGEGHNASFMPEGMLEMLIDAYTQSFAKTPIVGQIARSDLVNYANETRPTGYRCDCLGAMEGHMINFYPRAITKMDRDIWRYAPVAFESCWTVQHWYDNGWDIDEVIFQALKWHGSHFNAKSSRCPTEWKANIEHWLEHMGYRFAMRIFDFPYAAEVGDTVHCGMWIENRGCAPMYNFIPFSLRLKNDTDEYIIETKLDPRKWLPGDTFENFTVTVPDYVKPGEYIISAGLKNADKTTPDVDLAINAEHDDGFYHVAKVEVKAKQ